MSAVVIPFPGTPEPQQRPAISRREAARRGRVLVRHAAEWGVSITVNGPIGAAKATKYPRDIFPPGQHPTDVTSRR